MSAQIITAPPQTPADFLPADLRAWLPEGTLVYLALEAVQSISSPARGAREGQLGQSRLSQPILMTLLTYCYAIGLYGSKDIEVHTQMDRTVRYLCARNYPDWNLLRTYRRRNKDALRVCLEHLFAAAWQLRQSQAALPGGVAVVPPVEPSNRFAAEARERLARAVQADSIAMDE
jgi:hypothetical protein